MKKKKILEIDKKFQLILKEDFIKQVRYLNHLISKVEWIGTVFYEEELNEDYIYKITPKIVFLQNIGNTGSVNFKFDSDFIKFKVENKLNEMKYGLIHSHNSMPVFFSGTDEEEIVDNSENYDKYLSIVTNNFMDFTAKIAIKTKIKNEIKFEIPGKKVTQVNEDETVILIEAEIIREDFEEFDFIKKRHEKLLKNNKKKEKYFTRPIIHTTNYFNNKRTFSNLETKAFEVLKTYLNISSIRFQYYDSFDEFLNIFREKLLNKTEILNFLKNSNVSRKTYNFLIKKLGL